jgi:uncharacterized membrane protein YhaH (DUF805 family)
MKTLNRFAGACAVSALFTPLACFAQNNASNAAGGLAGCGCCGTFIFIPIALFVLSIALLVWVAKDAKARGMDNAVGWMALVFFLNLIGLVIYIFARPQGNTIACPNCGNQRLQSSVKCPHCGIGG